MIIRDDIMSVPLFCENKFVNIDMASTYSLLCAIMLIKSQTFIVLTLHLYNMPCVSFPYRYDERFCASYVLGG